MFQDNAAPLGKRFTNFHTIVDDLRETILLDTIKLNAIAKLFHSIYVYYTAEARLSSMALQWYAEDMMEYAVEEVEEAMVIYRRRPLQKGHNPRPPLPTDLKGILSPETDTLGEANRLANELWGLTGKIGKVGRENTEKAERQCGPLVWSAVLQRGGWAKFASLNETDQHMFIAQWRDYLRPLLEKKGTEDQLRLREEARKYIESKRERIADDAMAKFGDVVKKVSPEPKRKELRG